jgi:hypothetical protein
MASPALMKSPGGKTPEIRSSSFPEGSRKRMVGNARTA